MLYSLISIYGDRGTTPQVIFLKNLIKHYLQIEITVVETFTRERFLVSFG